MHLASARDAVGLDVGDDLRREGRREQLLAVVTRAEQVGDEVHAVVEIDPVDRAAAVPVGAGAVEALERGREVVDDDGVEVGRNERLTRKQRDVVVELEDPVRCLDGAEQLGHQVAPRVADGAPERTQEKVEGLLERLSARHVPDHALLQQIERLVQAHVHAARDRILQMVLLVRAELQGSREDQLAAPRAVGFRHRVAPEREAGPQAIAAFEFRRAVAHLQHLGPGRLRVVHRGAEATDERGRGRGDLGEDLRVPVGEVRRGRAEELPDHVARVLGHDVQQIVLRVCRADRVVGGPGVAHHAVGAHHALLEPLGQRLTAKVVADGARSPRSERAPVRRLGIEQRRQPRREIGVRLGHPVVAKDAVVDRQDCFDVRGRR